MKRYAFRSVLGLVLIVGALCATARGQDLTTQLSLFLVDLRAGILGNTQTFATLKLASGGIGTAANTTIAATAAGTVSLAGTTPMLQLGGTTSAFPALRRTNTTIEAVLADASAYTSLTGTSLVFKTSGGSSTGNLAAPSDKLPQLLDSAGATGLELNSGTPTLGTCTGGTLVSGAHNFGGNVTGTTGGSCVVNFGTPNFTNTPFCVANDESATPAANPITTKSASSITVTGITSGHGFVWLCFGRIGT